MSDPIEIDYLARFGILVRPDIYAAQKKSISNEWPSATDRNVNMLFELQDDEKVFINSHGLIQVERTGYNLQEPMLADQRENAVLPDFERTWFYFDATRSPPLSPVQAHPPKESVSTDTGVFDDNEGADFADAIDWISPPCLPEHGFPHHVDNNGLPVPAAGEIAHSNQSTPTQDLSVIVEWGQSPLLSPAPASRRRRRVLNHSTTLPLSFYTDTAKITRQSPINGTRRTKKWTEISQWLHKMCVQIDIVHSHPLLKFLAADRRAQRHQMMVNDTLYFSPSTLVNYMTKNKEFPEQARSDNYQVPVDDGLDYDFGGFEDWQDPMRLMGPAFNSRDPSNTISVPDNDRSMPRTSRFSSSFGERVASAESNKDSDDRIEPFGIAETHMTQGAVVIHLFWFACVDDQIEMAALANQASDGTSQTNYCNADNFLE
ncbi:hypothetical protein DFQ30_007954 [Apophysomyces sp. BC1015]|nr:hypothetical protein DFQ30_007954 [Apophysomyces sp. BC1015]